MVGINFPLAGLGGYNKQLDLNHFDRVIDWGWFYFITKPLFKVLDCIYGYVHNFGVAILMLTVAVKMVFFPLRTSLRLHVEDEGAAAADAGHAGALSRRQGQEAAGAHGAVPEGEDQPAGGLFPILIQVPVFFALYKVLYITIEMRHAHFCGWTISPRLTPPPSGTCSG